MKKLLAYIFSSLCIFLMISTAQAANPQVLMNLDCDTLEKQVNIGFLSDPANPSGGPEIIVFKFVLELTPTGTTTLADLASAALVENPNYTNVIIAKNTSGTVSNKVVLTIEGGFTGQNGLNNVADLLFLRNTNKKSFQISVASGELIPKNTINNIFVASPPQSYTSDPSTCPSQTPPVEETPPVQETNPITISSDKENAKIGDLVTVIGVI